MSKPQSQPKPQTKQLSFAEMFFAAIVGGNTAEVISLPFDTIKVKMQLEPGEYKSTMEAGRKVVAESGVKGLFRGAAPGMLRQTVYGGLRFSMFDFWMRKKVENVGVHNISILDRIFMGLTTGAIAMCMGNPADVVKVRMQAQGKAAPGKKLRYTGIVQAFTTIMKEEGIRGFYQSLGPNIIRNSIVGATEVATYSQMKYALTQGLNMGDGIHTHILSSGTAGALAAFIGSPADVLKSLIMDGQRMPDGTKRPFDSILTAIRWKFGQDGIAGFYKGLLPNAQRLVFWNIIMFVTKEQVLQTLRGGPAPSTLK